MIGEYIKTADWKAEKHVPVIECPDQVHAGAPFVVTVAVGREIPHPNEPGHHIAWAALYFIPEGTSAAVEVARTDFAAHGETVRTTPTFSATIAIARPGTLYATAYCNLHGLWTSEHPVTLGA